MTIDGKPIPTDELADEFANMFEKKINDIASTTEVKNDVYNGTRKSTSKIKISWRSLI